MDVSILSKKDYNDFFNSYFNGYIYEATIRLDDKAEILSKVCSRIHVSNVISCNNRPDNVYFTCYANRFADNIAGYTTFASDDLSYHYSNSRYSIHLFAKKMSVIADFLEAIAFTVSDNESLRFVTQTGESHVIFEKKEADMIKGSYSITVTETDSIYHIHSITEDVKRTIECYLNKRDKIPYYIKPDAAFNIRILDRNKNLCMLCLIHFSKVNNNSLYIQDNFDNGELIDINKTDISTIEEENFETREDIISLDHALSKIIFSIFEKRSKTTMPIERDVLANVIFYDVPMFLINKSRENKDRQEGFVYHIKVTYYTYIDHIFIELRPDGKYHLIIYRDSDDDYCYFWFSDYIYLVRKIETVLDVQLFAKAGGVKSLDEVCFVGINDTPMR